jgi:hypothetical protein
MRPINLSAAAAALLLAGAANGDELNIEACAFAKAPTLADGATATTEEMQASSGEVRAYHDAMQRALACLEQAEARLGADITDAQRAQVSTAYNQGYDQLEGVANAFNEQVRIFKSR